MIETFLKRIIKQICSNKKLSHIKRLIKLIVYNHKINPIIRLIARPLLYTKLKSFIKDVVSVVGILRFRLPNSKPLYIQTYGDDTLATTLYWKGFNSWEEFESIKLFCKILPKINTVFDIGANIGIYSLVAAINNPNKNVYAFEPSKRIAESLKRNIEINKLANLRVNCLAVTNYDGEILLYDPSSKFISTLATTRKDLHKDVKPVTVPALTLDTFVNTNDIQRVDLIKIDTEGTEHKCLEGAKDILKRDRPIIICEVLKGLTEKFLQEILHKFDYKYFIITNTGLINKKEIEGDINYKYNNYLFITPEKIETFI